MISEYFHPHWTGLAKAFLSLAHQLNDQGHKVSVLTTRFNPSLSRFENLGGLSIHRSEYIIYFSRTHYSLRIIYDFVRLARGADYIIVNSPFSNILPVSILTRALGKKLIIFHQGDLILAKHSGSRLANLAIERVFDISTIISLWLADSHSTYSLDYAEHSRVMRHFIDKFIPVIPPIRVKASDPGPDFKSKMDKLKDGSLLIGFAGRFVEEKGFDILLRAIPMVLSRYPQARFVFAGETNIFYEDFFAKNADLVQSSENRLALLGLLAEPELHYFYKSLDLFVLPSRSDCFALTQAEAALCGVPVVVSDIPGARVLVQSTQCGELARAEDPGNLCEAICKVLSDKTKYLSGLAKVP
ncbi:MAG: hypothetical protein DCC75_00935, partial [Proteobacteria bacterium]